MILIDTTIVVRLIRKSDPALTATLKALQAAVCGVTRAEILNGVRHPADRVRFALALDALDQVSIPDSLWDDIGLLLAALRNAGYTIPLADAIIAALAVELDVELWTGDQHFKVVQTVQPALRLFQPPP
jgi:predicted nucleic acid-binding protein